MFKYRTGILQIFMMAHDHDMYIHNTGIKKELGVKINRGFFGVEHYTDSPYEARNCTEVEMHSNKERRRKTLDHVDISIAGSDGGSPFTPDGYGCAVIGRCTICITHEGI